MLGATMDHCFTGLIDALTPFGGDVLTFGGDALFVAFLGDDHAERAVGASVAMMKALRAMVPMATPLGLVRLTMSVGVATGSVDVVVGDGPQRPLFAAGPTVSRAVRLEGKASPGEVRTDRATAEQIAAADRRQLDGGSWLVVRRRSSTPPAESATTRRVETLAPPSSQPTLHLPAALRSRLLRGDAPKDHRHIAVAFVRVRGLDRLAAPRRASVLALSSVIVGEACAAFDVSWIDADVAVDGVTIVIAGGLPNQRDDDELRLVASARRIVDSEFGEQVSIGVHRGTAFVGDVGHRRRRTYTVTGLTTVTAARLGAAAPPRGVLASTDVVDRLRQRYRCGPEQLLAVKGRNDPVRACTIEALATGTTPTVPTALVGRRAELTALERSLDAHREGHGSVVELVGPPGMGKSHLLSAFLADAPPPRLCVAGEVALGVAPFAALSGPLAAALGIDDPARRGALAAAGDLAPLLGSVFGVVIEATEATRLVEATSVPAVRAELVRTLLHGPPGLMIVEDVHWLDPSSIELLGAVVPGLAADGWLILIVRRPETAAFTSSDVTVDLQPLADDDVERLVAGATVDRPLSDARLEAIVQRAGGNALFAVQLARSAQEEGDVGLPESAERVVGARIDLLRPELRARLRRASVLGSRVELDVLGEVTDDPTDAAEQAWVELDEFVLHSPTEVEFRHDLFRLAAYEGLTYTQRSALHRRAADVLERRPESPAAVLAEHSLHAGRPVAVVRWATEAADDAAARAAFADEARLRRMAAENGRAAGLDGDQRAQLHGALARAYERIGELDAAEETYGRALATAAPAERAAIRTRLAWVSFRNDELSRARRRVGAALHHLPADLADRAVIHAELIVLRAAIRGVAGDRRGSDDDARWAEQEARRLGHDELLGQALMQLALNADLTDDPDAEDLVAEAVPLLEGAGLRREVAILQLDRANTHMVHGRWGAALASFDLAADEFRRCGFVLGAISTDANRGGLLLEQGHPQAASELFDAVVRRARAAGHTRLALFAAGSAHRARAWSGETDAAITGLGECVDEIATLGHRSEADDLDAYLVEVLVLGGRFDEAGHRAGALLERLSGRLNEVVVLTTMRLAAVVAHFSGDPGAIDDLTQVLELARDAGCGIEIARCLQALEACSNPVDPRWAGERDGWCRELEVAWMPPVTFWSPGD